MMATNPTPVPGATYPLGFGNFTAYSDYATALANDGAIGNITGNASLSTSDNLVLPGADNDVVVLGTTVGATAVA